VSWGKKTPKEKGESFDAQYAQSQTAANKKRAEGKYPYDLDSVVSKAGQAKPEEKRGKGKHKK